MATQVDTVADRLVDAARTRMWDSGVPRLHRHPGRGRRRAPRSRASTAASPARTSCSWPCSRTTPGGAPTALTAMVDVEADPARAPPRRRSSGCSGSSPSTDGSPMRPPSCASTSAWPSRAPTSCGWCCTPFVGRLRRRAVRGAQAAGAVRAGDARARRPHAVPSRAVPPARAHLPPDRGRRRPRWPRTCGRSARRRCGRRDRT